MNDPIGSAARAAAQQLQAEAEPGLVAEVEAVLATRESPSAPPQYVDPVALASLIVAITDLAWAVYADLKRRTAQPSAEVIARTVRVTRQDQGQAARRTTSSRSSLPRPSTLQPIKSVRRANQAQMRPANAGIADLATGHLRALPAKPWPAQTSDTLAEMLPGPLTAKVTCLFVWSLPAYQR
jgi:hypothetical protein